MKRIALTQRVDSVDEYDERRDCLDQRWTRLLSQAGLSPVPLPNCVTDVENYLLESRLDGAILTGGNDISSFNSSNSSAPERDAFELAVLEFFVKQNKPVLGVCHGMQMIANYFGCKVAPLEGHVGTRHRVCLSEWWTGKFGVTASVNSYHNYGIRISDGTTSALSADAWSDDGYVEAFHNEVAPVFGVMWHPEREETPTVFEIDLLINIFG